jgi:hypothetical protein
MECSPIKQHVLYRVLQNKTCGIAPEVICSGLGRTSHADLPLWVLCQLGISSRTSVSSGRDAQRSFAHNCGTKFSVGVLSHYSLSA